MTSPLPKSRYGRFAHRNGLAIANGDDALDGGKTAGVTIGNILRVIRLQAPCRQWRNAIFARIHRGPRQALQRIDATRVVVVHVRHEDSPDIERVETQFTNVSD